MIDGDRLQRFFDLALLSLNQAKEIGALGFTLPHFFLEKITVFDRALCNRVEQIPDALVDLSKLPAKLVEGVSRVAALRLSFLRHGGDYRLGPFGREQPGRQRIERQIVELCFRDGDGEIAGTFPVQMLLRAFVVAIGAAFAGGHHEGLAAALADSEPCQKDIAGR